MTRRASEYLKDSVYLSGEPCGGGSHDIARMRPGCYSSMCTCTMVSLIPRPSQTSAGTSLCKLSLLNNIFQNLGWLGPSKIKLNWYGLTLSISTFNLEIKGVDVMNGRKERKSPKRGSEVVSDKASVPGSSSLLAGGSPNLS